MPDPPSYPDTDDDVEANHGSPRPRSRQMYALWVIGGALIVAFVVLHLTGVISPGSH